MALPIFQSHPRGWHNPVNFRVAAALAAAGAWDAAPVVSFSAGAMFLTLNFTYTRGAAGGAFDFQIETSIYSIAGNVPAGAGEWTNPTAYFVGAVALGADTQSRIQQEYTTFGSQGAAAETIVLANIPLMGTIERIRVLARESADGIVATPGTLQITGEMF